MLENFATNVTGGAGLSNPTFNSYFRAPRLDDDRNFQLRSRGKRITFSFTPSPDFSGCFAAGIYIGLHFTVFAKAGSEGDDENNDDGKDRNMAYAVLCLFPIVAGIFLIFLWILVDQARSKTCLTYGSINFLLINFPALYPNAHHKEAGHEVRLHVEPLTAEGQRGEGDHLQ